MSILAITVGGEKAAHTRGEPLSKRSHVVWESGGEKNNLERLVAKIGDEAISRMHQLFISFPSNEWRRA